MQERQLWNNQNIQNYSFEQAQGSFSFKDIFRITVENGNVANEEVLKDSMTTRETLIYSYLGQTPAPDTG
jgi:hypothetical protein